MPISSFENPSRHAAVSDIIRRRSANHADLRDVVLQGLDLSSVQTVLDLGCGFGFMGEAIARRVAPAAEIVGVDACPANETPYLERLAAVGRRGRFVHRTLKTELDWPDDSFDLVVASFALYFFPNVLPEIARVLRPDGLFIAVTHTEKSCRDLLRAVSVAESGARLLLVIRNFCAENGSRLLTPWFAEVDRVYYPNALTFEATHFHDLEVFLRFKLPFLSPDGEAGGELPEPLARAARTALARESKLVFEKNDVAFRCRKPR